MKKYIKKMISIMVSVAILFSVVSARNFKAEETSAIETSASIESIQHETSSVIETTQQNLETTSSEIGETTSSENKSEEITSEESETVIYNENQQRVVNQINSMPESNQEDFMEKVKALYTDYLTLTEDEVKGISSNDKAKYESILASAGEINRTDEDTGISISADNLPWYVKVVAEKTDETVFKENYDAYIESLLEYDYEDEEYEDEKYEEDWEEEYLDEELEDEEFDEENYEDEEFEEDYTEEELEDEYVEDETYEDEELDNQDILDFFIETMNAHILNIGYNEEYDFSFRIMDTYDISLYDTLQETDYVLPEGTKVKVSIPYKKECLGNDIDILHLKSDGTYENIMPWLYNKPLNKILTFALYKELYGEEESYDKEIEDYYEEDYWAEEDEEYVEYEEYLDEEYLDEEEEDEEEYLDEEYLEDDEIDEYYEEAYRKYVEGYKEWAKEQNKKYNVDDYVIQFETDSFSEFAVCLNSLIYKTTDIAYGSVAPQTVPKNISPKTGTNIINPLIGIMCSSLLIYICIAFYRKREDDIV